MIVKVKSAIYRHERKRDDAKFSFYDVVHKILVDRYEQYITSLLGTFFEPKVKNLE